MKTFELSDIEKEAYHLFQTDLDLKHLDGLEPISIAKLYVQAGFDKKYDVEYALYTDREGYVQWSKEDHEEIPEAHRASEEHYINLFNTIDKGTFILTSEHTGYIKNDLNGFSMVKNEDGIWQVSFMPIQ
ncbi:RNA polymerase subunit sigma [Bacillus sp. PS06]|nr:RNA polymerase subunit sigma [Bacillus sp. PS06]